MPAIPQNLALKLLVALAIFAGLGLFAQTRAQYYAVQFFWDRFFADVHTFGDDCEVAVAAQPAGGADFAALRALGESLPRKHLKLPYKTAPLAEKPLNKAGEFVYSRCRVDLSKLRQQGYAWMRLHFVHGDSAIYLDGSLRQTSADLGSVEFPLLPSDRHEGALLELVSKPNALKATRLGLPTDMPLIFADTRAAFSLPNIAEIFERQLRPAYWVNYSLVLLLVFSIAWLGGLRREPVGWMIIGLASNAAMNVVLFSPVNATTPAMRQIALVLVFSTHLGLMLFAWTSMAARGTVGVLVYLAALAGYAGFVFVPNAVPIDVVAIYLPGGLQLAASAAIAIWGFRLAPASDAQDQWRRRFVASFCAAMAVVRVVDLAIYYETLVTFIEVVTEIGMTGFAAFLIYDLVVASMRYAEEAIRHLSTKSRADELEAIALAVQMVAHDVRKPFSLLGNGLAGIDAAGDLQSAQVLARRVGLEVQAAMRHANATLSDIMDAGRELSLRRETIGVGALLAQAVESVYRWQPESAVKIDYDLAASQPVAIDVPRVVRALGNIVENALQAMAASSEAGPRRLRLASRDDGAFVELSVWNSHSIIAEKDLANVFEAFFTKGKRTGTGLGLAIAKKMALAHGGSIRCTSAAGEGTAFHLRLPAGVAAAPELVPPRTKDGASAAPIDDLRSHRSSVNDPDKLPRRGAPGRRRIAVVEDDPFLREQWENLRAAPEIVTFSGPAAFWGGRSSQAERAEHLAAFDLIATDFYFDTDQDSDGLSFARSVRAAAPGAKIALFSDVDLDGDDARIFDARLGKAIPTPAALDLLLADV